MIRKLKYNFRENRKSKINKISTSYIRKLYSRRKKQKARRKKEGLLRVRIVRDSMEPNFANQQHPINFSLNQF